MRSIDAHVMDLRVVAKVLEDEKGMPVSAQSVRQAADRIEALGEMTSRPKHPQDMSLRELFDHVAIVNDAVRAALAGHPGCEPVRREVE